MRVSSWRTAISAVIWVLATLVDAQGYFYEPFTCSLSQNFEELGCYDVTGDPFTYALTNGYTGEDASRAYANYNTGGNNINSTVEANYCVQACRAHGFKYAALHNRACGCGTTLGSLVRSTDQTICYAVPDPNPCGGDRSENCGDPSGGGHARLFVDPSYESETSLIADGGTVVAGSYGYLGCFAKPNLPSNDANSDTRQTDSASCLAHCATSGYPLSYMYRDARYVG
ncbi:hypothetical protein BJ170DRAFT_108989 [Xylariales sp. AK1849]|nr:hypothetical protein BJ170DRAFT_108989 [Xylariales sp. AK1849]